MKTGLDLNDIVKVVADELKQWRKDLVEHIERRVKLAETKASMLNNETRTVNLHRRITQLESEVRQLTRNRNN